MSEWATLNDLHIQQLTKPKILNKTLQITDTIVMYLIAEKEKVYFPKPVGALGLKW